MSCAISRQAKVKRVDQIAKISVDFFAEDLSETQVFKHVPF